MSERGDLKEHSEEVQRRRKEQMTASVRLCIASSIKPRCIPSEGPVFLDSIPAEKNGKGAGERTGKI
jgi:hypothetical protein